MINSIVGLMNSGKTLYMTYKLYCDFLEGKEILTNYKVNFPHRIISQEWLLDIAGKEDTILTNVSIGLDELWLWLMDCRNSTGKESRVASYFFLQSSKDDTNIYITAQDNGQNDSRLRTNFHIITQCSRVIWTGNKFKQISSEFRFLEKKYGDAINNILFIKAEIYKRKLFRGALVLEHTGNHHIPAKYVFDLYSTSQKIESMKK